MSESEFTLGIANATQGCLSKNVDYNPSDPCVCGCAFKEHDELDKVCWACYMAPFEFNCFEFKLDNLKYVEEEAKRRGLTIL